MRHIPYAADPPWSDTELAYLAGIIDGEGTINLRRTHGSQRGTRYHNFQLQVSNTDERLIGWLQRRFGGSVGIHRQRRERSMPLHRWNLYAAQAEHVLRAALPYLRIKREVAVLCLQMRATVCFGNNRITDEVHAERERIFAQVRLLNQRGRLEAHLGVDV